MVREDAALRSLVDHADELAVVARLPSAAYSPAWTKHVKARTQYE
jgi:hypothetical protein